MELSLPDSGREGRAELAGRPGAIEQGDERQEEDARASSVGGGGTAGTALDDGLPKFCRLDLARAAAKYPDDRRLGRTLLAGRPHGQLQHTVRHAGLVG